MFAYVSYIWIARRAHSPLKNVSFARSHTTFFFFFAPLIIVVLFAFFFVSFPLFLVCTHPEAEWGAGILREDVMLIFKAWNVHKSEGSHLPCCLTTRETTRWKRFFFLLRDKWVCEQSHPLFFFPIGFSTTGWDTYLHSIVVISSIFSCGWLSSLFFFFNLLMCVRVSAFPLC